MKFCNKCKTGKEAKDFVRSKANGDGLYSYCKVCHTNKVKKYQSGKVGRMNHNARSSEWEKRNRIKKNAHSAVKRALKSKVLVRLPCIVCKSTEDVEAHHYDYLKRLEVIWVCPKHHAWIHSEKITLFQLLISTSHEQI
jgi:ribosomal protein L44E